MNSLLAFDPKSSTFAEDVQVSSIKLGNLNEANKYPKNCLGFNVNYLCF